MNNYLKKNKHVFLLVLIGILLIQIPVFTLLFYKINITFYKKVFSLLFMLIYCIILSLCISHFLIVGKYKKIDTLISINESLYMHCLSFLLVLFSYTLSLYLIFANNIGYISPEILVPPLFPLIFLTLSHLLVGDKFLIYGFKVVNWEDIIDFRILPNTNRITVVLKNGSYCLFPINKKLYDALVKKMK